MQLLYSVVVIHDLPTPIDTKAFSAITVFRTKGLNFRMISLVVLINDRTTHGK